MKSGLLVACEFSGVVRDAFIQQGVDAVSCDLLPSEKPGPHLQCDIYEAFEIRQWAGVIMFLPCTKIASCGNRHYAKGKLKHIERLQAIQWTKKTYKHACKLFDIVVFENPINVMARHIGPKSQTIHPYEHGHPEKKSTWLWIKGLPLLQPTKIVFTEMMKLNKRERERVFLMPPSPDRGHERSRTYPGIAAAMADQWAPIIKTS